MAMTLTFSVNSAPKIFQEHGGTPAKRTHVHCFVTGFVHTSPWFLFITILVIEYCHRIPHRCCMIGFSIVPPLIVLKAFMNCIVLCHLCLSLSIAISNVINVTNINVICASSFFLAELCAVVLSRAPLMLELDDLFVTPRIQTIEVEKNISFLVQIFTYFSTYCIYKISFWPANGIGLTYIPLYFPHIR